MSKKAKIKKVVIVLVIVALSFFAGMQYAKSVNTSKGGFAGGQGGGRFRGSTNGGGATMGEVLSKDATGITIKPRNGGSQIILVGPSTQVSKSVAGSPDDVKVGSNVMIVGTQNTDGSFTASSIQLRSGTSTPFGR